MVTEMTSLAGVMARDYALRAGETAEVAQALYETELPRTAGDALPVVLPGALLSLADRLDLLAGPVRASVPTRPAAATRSRLRRAALGVVASW